jgi:hypothetical protein
MNTYPISHEDKDQEWKTIQEIKKKQWVSLTDNTKQRHKPLTNNSLETQKNKMGHIHISWSQHKNNQKIIQEH